jgi:hypothetical protein
MSLTTLHVRGAGSPSNLDPPSPGPLANFAFAVMMDAEYREAYLWSPKATMAAYACDQPLPKADQKITAIKITSNNSLTTVNGSYSAGTDLGVIFLVIGGGIAYDIDDILNTDLYHSNLTFKSFEIVDVAQHHKFTIAISLDDGRTFMLTAEDAELTPG